MTFTKVHTQVRKLGSRKSHWFALAIGQPQGSHTLTAVSEQGHSLALCFPVTQKVSLLRRYKQFQFNVYQIQCNTHFFQVPWSNTPIEFQQLSLNRPFHGLPACITLFLYHSLLLLNIHLYTVGFLPPILAFPEQRCGLLFPAEPLGYRINL